MARKTKSKDAKGKRRRRHGRAVPVPKQTGKKVRLIMTKVREAQRDLEERAPSKKSAWRELAHCLARLARLL